MTRRSGDEERVPLTPAFLVAAANSYDGVDLARVVKPDETGTRSDVAFVNHVGKWSHWGSALRRSRWPLPSVRDAEELAEWATKEKLLDTIPLEGDVYLLWNPDERRFDRAGIVALVRSRAAPIGTGEVNVCDLIEGGSSADARALSPQVSRFVWPMGAQDRYVRWAPPAPGSPEMLWQEVA
jgi:hypothetical protein